MARLTVTVTPGAKTDEIVGRHGDGWRIRVSAPPERGRANSAVLRLLAAALAVRRSELDVVGGSTSRRKTVEIRGLSGAEVEARLSGSASG